MSAALRAVKLAVALSIPAAAQCVMCNRTAAAQNLARMQVLNTGIVVLLIPPLAILAVLTGYALRKLRRR